MFSSITHHNKQLKSLYQQLQNCLISAKNSDDLYQVVEQVKSFGKPLKYNNNLIYFVIVLLAIIAGVLAGFFSGSRFFIVAMIIIAILIILSIYFIFKRHCSFTRLSQSIFFKKVLFDNHLTSVEFNTYSLTQDLQHRFKDFVRGNHTREVQLLYAGEYQGKEHQFKYHYYQFHYVVKKRVTKTNSEGKTETTTEYFHYYRYGVFLPFPYVADLSLDEPTLFFKGGIYRPASNQFNRYYTVNGNSQMVAAKFLKPMVVQAFEDIHPQFSQLNFEFNSNNELCMSFDNDDTLYYKRHSHLNEPDKFLVELKEPKILAKLTIILEHIERLMTYSDNNFEIDK